MYKTALKHVKVSTDVFFVCLNHAMSTDGEEIVGLLVGEVDEERVAHVSAIVMLRRSDKRKDRVEISPEQLSNASTEAERLACIIKRPVRVIGWYHSHPKLTVWPSPIDVNTQDSYQLMDEGFIGIIFSVFNEDPNKKGGRIQMTCFQSQTVIDDCNIEKKRLDVPVHLVPTNVISSVCMNALIQLPRYLCQEEQLAYQMTNQVCLDYLTRLHNSSVYIKSMGQIAEIICGPLLKMLEERIINNELRRERLQNRKKELIAKIAKIKKEKELEIQQQKELEELAKTAILGEKMEVSHEVVVESENISMYEDVSDYEEVPSPEVREKHSSNVKCQVPGVTPSDESTSQKIINRAPETESFAVERKTLEASSSVSRVYNEPNRQLDKSKPSGHASLKKSI